MKILIIIGLVTVFLSAFFIFFVFDFIGRHYLQCTETNGVLSCSALPQTPLIAAIFFTALFVAIIILTAYLIIRNIRETEELF